MRYGRTSLVNFVAQLGVTVSGFVTTIFLTRTLGPERYGTYVVVLTVVTWAAVFGDLGITKAVRKRISEDDNGNYVVAGGVSQLLLYAFISGVLWLLRPVLNSFIGADAALILILMLAVRLFTELVRAILDGQHLVHMSSLLSPVEWVVRGVFQISLVLLGFGLGGAFAGYLAGGVIAVALGSYFVTVPNSTLTWDDLTRLRSYARFSWLGTVKGRTFHYMDVIILAYFVANSVIAVYSVAWNIASLFALFGNSVSRALFPAMSRLSSSGESDMEIARLLRLSLIYSGLFIAPGLVGAALVGDVVLTVYGGGFESGYWILLVLTVARLLYGYMHQFVNTIDAIDRPDLTLNANLVFVISNVSLNVALIPRYGWYGAASATVLSSGIGLVAAYWYAIGIIDVRIPTVEIAKQWASTGVMATVVLGGRTLFGESLLVVVLLVAVGSGVYFTSLLALSKEVRSTVLENLSVDVSVFGTKQR